MPDGEERLFSRRIFRSLGNRGKGFRHPLKIRTKIILMGLAFFGASLAVVGFVTSRKIVAQFETRLGENAMNVALSVSEIPDIQRSLGKPGGERVIQPIAERIRRKTGAEYIVLFDMRGVRYSHPVEERIGKTFVGGDEGLVFRGETYVSKAVGTLGPSMRAFVPVYFEGDQVGAVAVGILLTEVRKQVGVLNRFLQVALLLGLGVGFLGATVLAWDIKRAMGGLEPHEIALVVQELDSVIEAVPEGIVAVDAEGRIRLMNRRAEELLRVEGDSVGRSVEEVIPSTRLPAVLATGESELDQEQNLLGSRILTNRIPVKVKGRVVGAIASFRDMTQVLSMAEELTGVKRYVEALRVQNHEFLNKLQAISGLVQLGEYARAVEFISGIVETQRSLMSFIARRVKNPSLGGLLLGKSGRCKELNISFSLDQDSFCGPLEDLDSQALVLVVGNLLENAMEAVLQEAPERRVVEISIFDESGGILVSVRDTGGGISPDLVEHIFEKGFSTKGLQRGYGLFNVKNVVDACGGDVSVHARPGGGTEFLVRIPHGTKEGDSRGG
jgi:two-component system CitB family sensor kinase